MSHVAFLGTGLIGGGMVEAMLGRGLTVHVYNRSREKAEALAARGAIVAASPADAVRGAERVHVALSDDAAVDAVLDAAGSALADGVAVIDHSTTSPPASARAWRVCPGSRSSTPPSSCLLPCAAAPAASCSSRATATASIPSATTWPR